MEATVDMRWGNFGRLGRCFVATMAAAGLLAVSPSWAVGQTAPGQPGPAGQPGTRQPGSHNSQAPDSVAIGLANGQSTRLATAAIRQAATGPIDRLGQTFSFTPLAAVMKAAGIPAGARIRVTAGERGDQLTLERGSKTLPDPDHFGFIFNLRGWPVLTPRPGTPPAAAPEPAKRPQVRDVTRIEVVHAAKK